ncbi:hypothetical protein NC652_020876 [Populus alba x Populus x berolinensis]|nr:hypothetical protein NC651_020098 [Populus alba x Populus x berolinensis]KAJ6910003.1 hypothetical protein NC652_020876 [Populus alba x Populus x berolinensis]
MLFRGVNLLCTKSLCFIWKGSFALSFCLLSLKCIC